MKSNPHRLTSLSEPLHFVFEVIDREALRRFRTISEQRVACRLMEVFETIGEEARNEAARRYNVYPLRGPARPGKIDAERLSLYQAGEAIAEAAHSAKFASWRKNVAG